MAHKRSGPAIAAMIARHSLRRPQAMPTVFSTKDVVNIRSAPRFGDTILGQILRNTACKVTGPQQGDRWLPVHTTLNGSKVAAFISKNVVREQVSRDKEALVGLCVDEWHRFERGNRKEFEEGFAGRVGDYWSSIGMGHLDGLDRDTPWSAAFISYVVRQAGAAYDGFSFAAAHARYINASIRARQARQNSPFWGFRLHEHKPAIGDMVCRWRANRIDFDHAAGTKWFKSHCDIVCGIEANAVFTIGGNVSHSVKHTRYKTDARGYLTGAGNAFAVLRSNR